MNARKQFRFDARVILTLLIASISAVWLVPTARAQGSGVVAGVVDGETIYPGDTIDLGYEVSISDPDTTPTTVSLTSTTMQLSVACPNGSSQTITINPGAGSFLMPGSFSGYLPSENTYEGSVTAPSNLCGGKPGRENGAQWFFNYGVTCHKDSNRPCCHKVCFQFHHRHHHQDRLFVGNSGQPICFPEKECVSKEKSGCCKTQP